MKACLECGKDYCVDESGLEDTCYDCEKEADIRDAQSLDEESE